VLPTAPAGVFLGSLVELLLLRLVELLETELFLHHELAKVILYNAKERDEVQAPGSVNLNNVRCDPGAGFRG
jgi:hypothetical protein